MNQTTAMILAAGRGQRLRPLTDHTPKPLIEVGGLPLIGWHLTKLQQAGFQQVIINTAHLAEQIEARIGDGARWGLQIEYSREGENVAQALETAGGIRKALAQLSDPFVLINGDVFTDLDYQQLRKPMAANCDFKCWLVDNPAHHPDGDFALSASGALSANNTNRLTYSGIGQYRKHMFAALPIKPTPLGPILHREIAAGRGCGAHHQGLWIDVGTPERLAQARQLAE